MEKATNETAAVVIQVNDKIVFASRLSAEQGVLLKSILTQLGDALELQTTGESCRSFIRRLWEDENVSIIPIIKEVRERYNMNLREAKLLVEDAIPRVERDARAARLARLFEERHAPDDV